MLVEPFVNVGPLFFKDNREQIRGKLNQDFEPGVNEFNNQKEYFDYFPDMDFVVFYDENDLAQAFNFFEPNPVFDGRNLLTEPYIKTVEFFSEIDPDLFVDETSFTSNKYGVGGHCPYKGKDGMAPPESVIIFSRDYYGN